MNFLHGALTICDQCGGIDERDALLECELNGHPARVCLPCIADLMKWVKPRADGSEGSEQR